MFTYSSWHVAGITAGNYTNPSGLFGFLGYLHGSTRFLACTVVTIFPSALVLLYIKHAMPLGAECCMPSFKQERCFLGFVNQSKLLL